MSTGGRCVCLCARSIPSLVIAVHAGIVQDAERSTHVVGCLFWDYGQRQERFGRAWCFSLTVSKIREGSCQAAAGVVE
jgi:hypothetical protein